MVIRYRLFRPVIGFVKSAKEVVAIPAGAVVTAQLRATSSPGLCTVVWDEKIIDVYRMDLDRHGLVRDADPHWVK